MQWTPARFSRPEADRIVCVLCPHECRLADGDVGACRVRRRSGDGLETASFATAVSHLDAVERKPLYHFRPGTRVLTLAPPGCTFACRYCQNYALSQFGREPDIPWTGAPVDPAAIVDRAAAHGAGVALSYSEPTLAAELTLALAAAARGRGVPILWKTNGFITAAAQAELAPCLAAVNVDLKAGDERSHRALTAAPLAPVLAALGRFAAAGIWVEVSTPLIPTVNADPDSLRRIADHVRALGPDVPWHLGRFNPEYRLKHLPPTADETFHLAVDVARAAGLRHVYIERALGPFGRRTACPTCGTTVVERDIWTTTLVTLVDGKCPTCGTSIPGRWDWSEP
jgi:pyruvate formate lyase activating enzyme